MKPKTPFVPYTNQDSGFSGVVPESWIEKGPGEFGRGDPAIDPTFLVQWGRQVPPSIW